MATEEIQISGLELADGVLADMVLPVDTATDTKAVTLKQLKAWLGSSLPTGFIIPAVGKISDERFTLLDGKTLSRAGTYQAFCNKVVEQVQEGNWFACSEEEYNADVSTFGQCGRFVIANDYVRIPKITRFIGATITLSEIGKTYKESLPNIKGGFNGSYAGLGGKPQVQGGYGSFDAVGSIGTTITQNYANTASGTTDAKDTNWINFDASLSSPTYQDGAKVQPDHVKYPYYMVISTEGQTAEVGVDINKVYEDMNLKANTTLSNVSSNIDYVVESYVNGNNWYRIYRSGWCEQGGYINANYSGTINFLKAYKKVVIVSVSVITKRAAPSNDKEMFPNTVENTNFTISNMGGGNGTGGYWEAKGLIA